MRTAGWRSFLIYGCTIALCQPLAACGSAENPAPSTNDGAASTKAAAIPADAPLVIAFGDSLYAGYQLGPKEGLAPQLQAALVADGTVARVQNAGVSGDTTAAGLQRLPRADQGYDQKAQLWLAPELGYLPARIRLTQANGDFADLRLMEHGAP